MKTDWKTLKKKMEENGFELDCGDFIEDGAKVSRKIVCKIFKCSEDELNMCLKDLELYESKKETNFLTEDPFETGALELESIFKLIIDSENLHFDCKNNKYYRIMEGSGTKAHMNQLDFNSLLSTKLEQYKIANPTKVTTKSLEGYVTEHIKKILFANKVKIHNQIKYCGSEDFADIYLDKLYKTFDFSQKQEIFTMLMKHFTWQIKRRSSGMSTYYDLMIAIFGSQGIGKSYVMNSIFTAVLEDLYTASITLEDILDKNNARLLIDQYLINIEELAKSGDTLNVDTGAKFKKLLTDEIVTYRPFFTQEIAKDPIRASFISTANKHIYTLIKDPTGMRRFFEFTSQLEPNSRVNDEDSLWLKDNAIKFFRSIDENRSKGYWEIDSSIGKLITEIQNSYSITQTDEWLINNFTKDLSLTFKQSEYTEKDIFNLYKAHYEEIEGDPKYKKSKSGLLATIETRFGIKDLFVKGPGGNKKLRLRDLTPEEKHKSYIIETTKKSKIEEEDDTKPTQTKSKWEGVD